MEEFVMHITLAQMYGTHKVGYWQKMSYTILNLINIKSL